MADEIIAEEVIKEDVVTTDEDVASTKGWKPKESFTGDPNEWVDAKEFLAREPLYKALHRHSRENKQLREAMDNVVGMFKKSEATAKERAMTELREQFEAAAEVRDVKKAIEVRDKMKELESSGVTPGENKVDSTKVLNDWKAENDWFDSDPKLRRFANGLGSELYAERVKANGKEGLSIEELKEIYTEVSKAVKNEFPEKFVNPNRQRHDSVNTTNKRTSTDSKSNGKVPGIDKLPDDAKVVALKVVKSARNPKGMDPEKYIEMYLAAGGTLKTE
jgi:hypothetical protein